MDSAAARGIPSASTVRIVSQSKLPISANASTTSPRTFGSTRGMPSVIGWMMYS